MKTLTKFAAVALLAVTASHSAMAQYNHEIINGGGVRVAADADDIQVNQHGIRFIDVGFFYSKPTTDDGITYTKAEVSFAVNCTRRVITTVGVVYSLNNAVINRWNNPRAADQFLLPASYHHQQSLQIACSTPMNRLRRI